MQLPTTIDAEWRIDAAILHTVVALMVRLSAGRRAHAMAN